MATRRATVFGEEKNNLFSFFFSFAQRERITFKFKLERKKLKESQHIPALENRIKQITPPQKKTSSPSLTKLPSKLHPKKDSKKNVRNRSADDWNSRNESSPIVFENRYYYNPKLNVQVSDSNFGFDNSLCHRVLFVNRTMRH